MTSNGLDLKSASLEALRMAWEDRILPTVRAKAADAHAHALKSVTDTLRQTDDGRASLLRLNRSPSHLAAGNRLDELWTWLAGPSERSLKGAIRDAREAFYREACVLWWPLIPAEYRGRKDHPPTADHVRQIRAAAIHGYDPRNVLEGPIQTAVRTLKAATEQAARRSVPGGPSDDSLKAWETRTVSALSSVVVGLLSDSVEYANTEAGKDLIHPDFIEDE